jgi:hypothetical protein
MKNNEIKQLKDKSAMYCKMVLDYSQGKIYKIEPTCPHEEWEVYIGSTSIPRLCNRLTQHKAQYKLFNDDKITKKSSSCYLFDKYGVENCQIFLIENVNAKTKDELRAREHFYITNTKCVNANIPLPLQGVKCDSMSEWRKIHYVAYKEKKLAHQKQYNMENASKISEQQREYRNRDGNKEKAAEYYKHYYANKKKEMAEQQNKYRQSIERVQCPCGGKYRLAISEHLRSIRHQKYEQQQTNKEMGQII